MDLYLENIKRSLRSLFLLLKILERGYDRKDWQK